MVINLNTVVLLLYAQPITTHTNKITNEIKSSTTRKLNYLFIDDH